MSEHTCRPLDTARTDQQWWCQDCGRMWDPSSDGSSDGPASPANFAIAGVVLSVGVAAAATWWGSPALAAVLAVPGLVCAVYALWHLLRS